MGQNLVSEVWHLPTCSNLYTLEGGVHNYLREEGGDLWNGSLFVFDGRMAIPAPGAHRCHPLLSPRRCLFSSFPCLWLTNTCSC